MCLRKHGSCTVASRHLQSSPPISGPGPGAQSPPHAIAQGTPARAARTCDAAHAPALEAEPHQRRADRHACDGDRAAHRHRGRRARLRPRRSCAWERCGGGGLVNFMRRGSGCWRSQLSKAKGPWSDLHLVVGPTTADHGPQEMLAHAGFALGARRCVQFTAASSFKHSKPRLAPSLLSTPAERSS